jgi:hypothetical protein
MIYFDIERNIDVKEPLKAEMLPGSLFADDNRAHRFTICVLNGGQKVDLTNNTVMAYFLKSDGVTITQSGSIGTGTNTNRVQVIMPQNAYGTPGPLDIVIRVTDETGSKPIRATVGAFRAYVQRTSTDTVVSGNYEILDIEAVLAMIADVEEATAAANTAASAANTAAEKLENMDATATARAPGEAPTAAVTTVSGHYRLSLGLPKGDTGEPARVVGYTYSYGVTDDIQPMPDTWSDTMPAVPQGKYLWIRTVMLWNDDTNSYQFTVSRQGLDGSGSVGSVNGISPDSSHNVTLPTDNAPASGSANYVTSGGVYSALQDIKTRFKSGTITSGTVPATDALNLTVTFSEAFPSAPVVIANVYQTGTEIQLYINRVDNITKTGCTIQVRNVGTTARDLTSSRNVSWIAFCP